MLSQVMLVVNNLPANEMWVRSMDWEDPLEEGMGSTLVFLPRESHGQSNLAGCIYNCI